jgi:hypothetical protein
MKLNIGDGERLIRVILGIYAMLLGFLFIQGVVGIILGILGLIAFATGASGWCGIYALLGKSTLQVTPAEPEQSPTEDKTPPDNEPDEVVNPTED